MQTQDDYAYCCTNCDCHWYYRKPNCPRCASERIKPYKLETAVVVSTTTVHATPEGVRSPNHLALVQFENVNVIAQVTNEIDELTAGDEVRFNGRHDLREDNTGPTRGPRLSKL